MSVRLLSCAGKQLVCPIPNGSIKACERDLLPKSVRLVFAGEGQEYAKLASKVERAGVGERVGFAGHVPEVEKLRDYYARAISSVSLSYVGLSATQSFSFGVPMLVARDEFHSPDIEACQAGFNAQNFESYNAKALTLTLSDLSQNKCQWLDQRTDISGWTKSRYSFEAMADAFLMAASAENRRKTE